MADQPRLGDKLIAQGLINADQLAKALAEQASSHAQIGAILVSMGFITEAQLNAALAS